MKYGTSANYEGINDKLKGVFTFDHYVVITGLTPGATYHYRIQSRDPAGNLTVDDQDRAITLPALGYRPDQLQYHRLQEDGDHLHRHMDDECPRQLAHRVWPDERRL